MNKTENAFVKSQQRFSSINQQVKANPADLSLVGPRSVIAVKNRVDDTLYIDNSLVIIKIRACIRLNDAEESSICIYTHHLNSTAGEIVQTLNDCTDKD